MYSEVSLAVLGEGLTSKYMISNLCIGTTERLFHCLSIQKCLLY